MISLPSLKSHLLSFSPSLLLSFSPSLLLSFSPFLYPFSLLPSFTDMIAALLTKDAQDAGEDWSVCGNTVTNSMLKVKGCKVETIKKRSHGSRDASSDWAKSAYVEALQIEAQCKLGDDLVSEYGVNGTYDTWKREQLLRHGSLHRVVEGEWESEEGGGKDWWEGIVTRENGEGLVTISWNERCGVAAEKTQVSLHVSGKGFVEGGGEMPWRVPEFENKIVGRKVELYLSNEWKAGVVVRRNIAGDNEGRREMNPTTRGSYWVVFADGTGMDYDSKEMWRWRIQKAAVKFEGRATVEEIQKRKEASSKKSKKAGKRKNEAESRAPADAPKEPKASDRLPFPLFTFDGISFTDEIHKHLYLSINGVGLVPVGSKQIRLPMKDGKITPIEEGGILPDEVIVCDFKYHQECRSCVSSILNSSFLHLSY